MEVFLESFGNGRFFGGAGRLHPYQLVGTLSKVVFVGEDHQGTTGT